MKKTLVLCFIHGFKVRALVAQIQTSHPISGIDRVC